MDRTIYIWPDNTWCFLYEAHEYSWKSDDYREVKVSNEATDDDIEQLITLGII